MRRRGTLLQKTDSDDSSVWLSVGDLMSVLLMVFALLLVSALAQISMDFEQTHDTRVEIIENINQSLRRSGVEIMADPESGEVSILDTILFDVNAYELKPSGKAFLDSFVPIYANAIFQREKTAKEVNQIIIEGHSSSEGDFRHNMQLSVKRANSVANYLSDMNFNNKHTFFQKVLVAGRGALDANKVQAIDSDRKVKFRFQFRDDEFLEYLRNEPVI